MNPRLILIKMIGIRPIMKNQKNSKIKIVKVWLMKILKSLMINPKIKFKRL